MNEPENDTLIYIRPGATSEPKTIKFEFAEGPDIWEYKAICMRLASALGYNDKTIEKAFGFLD